MIASQHRRPGAAILACSLLVMLLTACGFQLRGAYELPAAMQVTHVSAANPNSELVRALKRALRANQLNLVEDPVAASAILRIVSESSSKRVLSVDSRGRAREYELQYQVRFDVSSKGHDFQLPEQLLALQREFLFDPEDVLGKGSEEAELLADMQQDMVRLMLLRLQARAKAELPPEAETP